MKLKMNFIRAAFVYGAAVAIFCLFSGCEKGVKTEVSEKPYVRAEDPAYTNRLHRVENARTAVMARLTKVENEIASVEQKISELEKQGESAAAERDEARRKQADLQAERKRIQDEFEKCRLAAMEVVRQGMLRERESALKAGKKASK